MYSVFICSICSKEIFLTKNRTTTLCRSCYKKNYYSRSIDNFTLGSKRYICDKKKELCVDHDHITGEIRGLLCKRCNIGLGYFKDDTDALTNAIKYLEAGKKN